MQDPTNPGESWQHVPTTPTDPSAAVPPTGGPVYSAPDPGYPPPPNYPPPNYQAPPNYPPQGPPPGYAQGSGLSSTAAAAISYLTFIPAVIFLVLDPYKRDPFIRFHAFQSIGLNVVGFGLGIVFAFLFVALHFVGMWMIIALIRGLVDLLLFVAWLIAIIQAAQGKWFKLPVIGDFAMKQSGQQ